MGCPHPEKVPHKTFDAAMKARTSLETERGMDVALRPYQCGDHWHLGHGHKTKTLDQKIRGLGSGRVMSRRRT